MRRLGQALQLVQYREGDIIIREGDTMYSELDGMYMLWEGAADVVIDGEVVHSYTQGDHFGELALLSRRGLRGATVAATGGHSANPRATHCLRLSKADFERLVPAGSAAARAALAASLPAPPTVAEIAGTLAKGLFFTDIPPARIEAAAAGAELLQFADGQLMVSAGEDADGVYIVEHGAAAAEREGEVVLQYSESEMFGELSVLSGKQRAATVAVRAVGPTRCIRIGVAEFGQLSVSEEAKGAPAETGGNLEASPEIAGESLLDDVGEGGLGEILLNDMGEGLDKNLLDDMGEEGALGESLLDDVGSTEPPAAAMEEEDPRGAAKRRAATAAELKAVGLKEEAARRAWSCEWCGCGAAETPEAVAIDGLSLCADCARE